MQIISAKKHILYVDDDFDTCEVIGIILRNYRVTSAYSVTDALKRATAEQFDLYILDYHLPDATGLDLCLRLRTFDTKTPILFATATSSITERQVISAGAQGLISKGGRSFIGDLLATISRLINSN